RFEGFMQELIDRRVVRMLGGSLQPAELAHAIGRCIEQQQVDGLAPNRFEVLLNPDDYADLRGLNVPLEPKLAAYAVELAREHSVNFAAPPAVELAADATLDRGQVQVRGAVERASTPPPRRTRGRFRGTLSLEVPRPGGAPARLPIDHVPFMIGRREGNDLVLADRGVSREHAVIEQQEGRYRLRDLGSRNGTLVNGQPIIEADLSDGDRVGVGGFEATVRLG
ncbi:MAG: DUF3662 domain-containing protein, partial [Chloroflexi bacterium]|nr:DUF3662 domain-containing protein [Chloroflexota bacterium]